MQIGFIPLVFTGAFGIPFAPPKSPPPNAPLVFVMAKPIHVPHIPLDDPDRDNKLRVYQQQFVDSMQRLYDTYAPRFDARYLHKDEPDFVKPTLRIL